MVAVEVVVGVVASLKVVRAMFVGEMKIVSLS